jgi:hypothetical protein
MLKDENTIGTSGLSSRAKTVNQPRLRFRNWKGRGWRFAKGICPWGSLLPRIYAPRSEPSSTMEYRAARFLYWFALTPSRNPTQVARKEDGVVCPSRRSRRTGALHSCSRSTGCGKTMFSPMQDRNYRLRNLRSRDAWRLLISPPHTSARPFHRHSRHFSRRLRSRTGV